MVKGYPTKLGNKHAGYLQDELKDTQGVRESRNYVDASANGYELVYHQSLPYILDFDARSTIIW